jgi:hypothetical protein
MELYSYLKNKLNRRAAAVICVALLLLAALAPCLPSALSPERFSSEPLSAKASLSASIAAYDFTIYPTPTQVGFSQWESKSVYDCANLKKASTSDAPASLQNHVTGRYLNGASLAISFFANFLQKSLKSSYLLADIPPPFFKV